MQRLGLTSRYVIVVLVSSVLAALAVSVLLRGGLRERERTQAIREIENVALSGVQTVISPDEFRFGLAANRAALLSSTAELALEQAPSLEWLALVDIRGEVMLTSDATREYDRNGVREAINAGVVTNEVASGNLLLSIPVNYGLGEPVGALQFEMNPSAADEIASAELKSLLVIVTLVIGIVQLLALPLLIAATRSLREVNTELAETSRDYEELATHDVLTGLPNRNLLNDRLIMALARAEREREHVAVVVIDLDGFKTINDTLGHAAGDQLLRGIGPRLQGAVRDGDTVARFGGDEFVLILNRVRDDLHAQEIVGRVLAAMRQPVIADGASLTVEGSAGVAMYPRDGAVPAELMRRADVALYVAKASTNAVRTYEKQMDEGSREHLTVLTDLRAALQNNEIVVHYQPIVGLQGRTLGLEALVRWQHPVRGMISPAIFVPAAERSGLIHELTALVLRDGLRSMRTSGLVDQGVHLSVNVSTRDLIDEQLVEVVREALRASGVPPQNLQLEITETVAMADPARAMKTLHALRELGVHLAIDDYGTGHSSLAYLQRLPVRTLKIDQQFISRMIEHPADATIVRSTIELAHNLGLSTVAEGVEDAETLQALAKLGCDSYQGYLLGRPCDLEATIAKMRQDEPGALVASITRPVPVAIEMPRGA